MQLWPNMRDYDDLPDDDVAQPRKADVEAMRILSQWIARHDGFDPATGLTIERDFVVVE